MHYLIHLKGLPALGFSSKNAISFARLSKICIAFFAKPWSFGENKPAVGSLLLLPVVTL